MNKILGWNPTQIANWLAAIILVLVPFHAFWTIWSSQLVGHYTALRLWDEGLLTLLVLIALGWLARETATRRQLFGSLLFRLIVAYGVLTLALGFIALAKDEVTAKAFGYALVVNLRFLLFFVAVGLLAQRSDWLRTKWPELLLVPAALVCVFAVLQYTVLPHNFLTHFGYNAETNVAPIETINHNSHYIRVQSTLRGANPLGAYLVIIAAVLASMYFVRQNRRWLVAGFGVVAALALVFSGSRSAWIGAFLAALVILWLQLKTKRARWRTGAIVLAGLIVLGGTFLALRNNTALQNTLWHTQKNSKVRVSSNSAHESALRSGLSDIVHEPFGRGPGTAGPESVYNTGHPTRIAENYYVQIAQETGWAGLLLVLGIFGIVAIELYRARASVLGLALFASLIGLTFVNFLSHAWADDTLAYSFWGLAGLAIAAPVALPPKKR